MNPAEDGIRLGTGLRASQRIADRLRSGAVPVDEVRTLLHDASTLIRVNAMEALIEPARHDAALLRDLEDAARHPENQIRLMGLRAAHYAIACLLRVGTREAIETATALVSGLPDPERSDVTRWLRLSGFDPERAVEA